MTIAEIIAIESARQEQEQLNVIHLIKEGDFYRAHDWSAWLMSAFPFGETLEKPLKVLAKKLKDGYIDAFCGFPASSIGKYIPQDMEFNPVNDTQIDVKVTLPDGFDATFDAMSKKKEDWKLSLPLVENKKHKREDHEIQEQAPRIIRFTDIISRIVSLPMDEISPREALDILRNIRRQVIALF